MRVVVCGGREFGDALWLFHVLDRILLIESDVVERNIVLMHGAATGADTYAGEWAKGNGVRVEEFPAAWNDMRHPCIRRHHRVSGVPYNALAGKNRNQRMIDVGKPDLVIAFPGGPGTADMVRRAMKAGVKVVDLREAKGEGR